MLRSHSGITVTARYVQCVIGLHLTFTDLTFITKLVSAVICLQTWLSKWRLLHPCISRQKMMLTVQMA